MYASTRENHGRYNLVSYLKRGWSLCGPKSFLRVRNGYNLKNERFVRHPKTKVFLSGLQVPRWDEVKNLVLEAAMLNPNIGHCAWDVAVSEEKVSLIEANDQGNFDLIQCASRRGCKLDYDKIIKQRNKNNYESNKSITD